MITISIIIGFITAYINGMHDGGTIVATTITARIMKPKAAVFLAGISGFAGAILLGQTVVHTMRDGIVDSTRILADNPATAQYFVIAAFLASMVWNLFTWVIRLSSSASHSLIGAMIGCALVAYGSGYVLWSSVLTRVVLAMVLSPLIGFVLGFALLKMQNALLRNATIRWNSVIKRLELVSTVLLSFSYGSNEAQKVAGLILFGVTACGASGVFGVSLSGSGTLLLVALCGACLGIGTITGGYNMIRTIGKDIVKINTDRAFCSQLASILVVEFANLTGLPISSTQVLTGTVMGVGTEDRPRSVNWKLLKNIAIAWVLTLPASAAVGALLYKAMLLIFL